MLRRHLFLLIFFLPVSLGIGTAFLFGWYKFSEHEKEHRVLVAAQSGDLQMNASASKLTHDMLDLQIALAALLKDAQAGKADEASAYRFHTRLIDTLADMDQRLTALHKSNPYPGLEGEFQQAQAAFFEYRRLTSTATDIVAVDPKEARNYIEAANFGYFDFSKRMQHVGQGIMNGTLERMAEGEASLKGELLDSIVTALFNFAVMSLLWLIVVWTTARYLSTISEALSCIAQNRALDKAQADQLKQIKGFFLKDLANTAIAFDAANRARSTAENELRLEQKQLNLLLKSMPDLVWFKDADGRYVRCNPRFEAFAGRPEQELIGLSDIDVFPPEDAAQHRARDLEAIKSDGIVTHREWRTFHDGHRELIETHKTAVYDSDGTLCGVLGVGRDVTAEYTAQKNLLASEDTLKRTQAVARIGSWIYDFKSNVVIGSEAASKILGIPLELTLTPKDFFRSVYPDDKAYLWENWRTAKLGGVFDIEHRILINNETHWIRQRAEIEYDSTGLPTRAVGMLQDITSIKTATEALRQREAIFSSIVGQADSGTLLVDSDTLAFIEFNDAACKHLGYSRDEFAKMGIFDIQVDESSRQAAESNRQNILAHGGSSFEKTYRCKDGSLRDFWVSAKPLEMGGRSRLAIVWNDITERKQVEKDLENYREHLEELVAERTLELAAARDAAQSASRSKSAFLANMSHEIRTPMNAIIGLTHMLRRDSNDARQSLQLDKVAGAANHLLGIINDILDFSKIEAGKLSLEPVDFDIDHVVSNACGLVTEKVQAKNLELVADISALPPMLRGDSLRLGQVLLNFLSNAVKFTERGSVVLRGSIVEEQPETLLVRFEVQDSGIGMDAEQQGRLFQAFEQADVSTTRKYGGTGLGLAISRRLVELMDGRIGVQSTPGSGSTFWIEIPLGKVAGTARRRTEQVLPAGTRALVIDDIEDARNSLASALQELGARPDIEASPLAALEAVLHADETGDPYRLILVDWQMPEMDGVAFGQALGKLTLQVRPMMFLVSGTLGAPHAELENNGFAGFIAKPMTPSALLVALERFHDQQGNTEQQSLSRQQAASKTDHDTLYQQLAGRRILLAEDNLLNQEVALDMLNMVGLRVDVAGNGQQALDMATACADYELILMDVQMPKMDGLDATRQIRRLPGYQITPIIAMTANAFEEDRQTALASGMNDHIAKPVEPSVLYTCLTHWLPATKPAAITLSKPDVPVKILAYGDNSTLDAIFDAIPGLNKKSGLRSTLGQGEKLLRFLLRFAETHRHDAETLEAAILAEEHNKVRLVAHTLKGTAATLGLEVIAECANRIQQAVEHNQPVAEQLQPVHELASQLEQVCNALISPESTHSPIPATGTPGLHGLKKDLRLLRQLIATDDIAAIDAYNRLKVDFVAIAGRSAERLGKEIEDFAYDEALATLDAIVAADPKLQDGKA
jgi:PAS domain S-box-containing protein